MVHQIRTKLVNECLITIFLCTLISCSKATKIEDQIINKYAKPYTILAEQPEEIGRIKAKTIFIYSKHTKTRQERAATAMKAARDEAVKGDYLYVQALTEISDLKLGLMRQAPVHMGLAIYSKSGLMPMKTETGTLDFVTWYSDTLCLDVISPDVIKIFDVKKKIADTNLDLLTGDMDLETLALLGLMLYQQTGFDEDTMNLATQEINSSCVVPHIFFKADKVGNPVINKFSL